MKKVDGSLLANYWTATRALLSDRSWELPSWDIGGEGPFMNFAQFGCRQIGAQVKVAQFGRAAVLAQSEAIF